jgi:hypothetical protein
VAYGLVLRHKNVRTHHESLVAVYSDKSISVPYGIEIESVSVSHQFFVALNVIVRLLRNIACRVILFTPSGITRVLIVLLGRS